MAGRAAAQVLTEQDEEVPAGAANNQGGAAGGDESLELLRTGGEAGNEANEEYVLVDDDGQQGGGEERLTEEAGGERPMVGQGRAYSRTEIEAMSPEQRQQLWAGMDHDERRRNRHLGRIRQKDARRNGIAHTRDLERTVQQQTDELAALRQQIGGIGPRLDEFSRGQLQAKAQDYDRRLADRRSVYEAAKVKVKEAMQSNDGEALVEAMEQRDNASREMHVLQVEKDAFQRTVDTVGERQQQQRQQPQQQQRQPVQLPPQAQRYVRDFMSENPWYDPNAHRPGGSGDMDSMILTKIDAQVAAEGYNPNSQEYWDEVRERGAEALPDRFDDPEPTPRKPAQPAQRRAQPQRRGPMTNGSGEGVPRRPGQVQVRLTAERKQAMIDAGVLERDGRTPTDKKRFNSMVAQYLKYDRENGEARR